MGLVPANFCVQISSPRSPLGLVPFTKNRPLGLVPNVDREYKNKVVISRISIQEQYDNKAPAEVFLMVAGPTVGRFTFVLEMYIKL